MNGKSDMDCTQFTTTMLHNSIRKVEIIELITNFLLVSDFLETWQTIQSKVKPDIHVDKFAIDLRNAIMEGDWEMAIQQLFQMPEIQSSDNSPTLMNLLCHMIYDQYYMELMNEDKVDEAVSLLRNHLAKYRSHRLLTTRSVESLCQILVENSKEKWREQLEWSGDIQQTRQDLLNHIRFVCHVFTLPSVAPHRLVDLLDLGKKEQMSHCPHLTDSPAHTLQSGYLDVHDCESYYFPSEICDSHNEWPYYHCAFSPYGKYVAAIGRSKMGVYTLVLFSPIITTDTIHPLDDDASANCCTTDRKLLESGNNYSSYKWRVMKSTTFEDCSAMPEDLTLHWRFDSMRIVVTSHSEVFVFSVPSLTVQQVSRPLLDEYGQSVMQIAPKTDLMVFAGEGGQVRVMTTQCLPVRIQGEATFRTKHLALHLSSEVSEHYLRIYSADYLDRIRVITWHISDSLLHRMTERLLDEQQDDHAAAEMSLWAFDGEEHSQQTTCDVRSDAEFSCRNNFDSSTSVEEDPENMDYFRLTGPTSFHHSNSTPQGNTETGDVHHTLTRQGSAVAGGECLPPTSGGNAFLSRGTSEPRQIRPILTGPFNSVSLIQSHNAQRQLPGAIFPSYGLSLGSPRISNPLVGPAAIVNPSLGMGLHITSAHNLSNLSLLHHLNALSPAARTTFHIAAAGGVPPHSVISPIVPLNPVAMGRTIRIGAVSPVSLATSVSPIATFHPATVNTPHTGLSPSLPDTASLLRATNSFHMASLSSNPSPTIPMVANPGSLHLSPYPTLGSYYAPTNAISSLRPHHHQVIASAALNSLWTHPPTAAFPQMPSSLNQPPHLPLVSSSITYVQSGITSRPNSFNTLEVGGRSLAYPYSSPLTLFESGLSHASGVSPVAPNSTTSRPRPSMDGGGGAANNNAQARSNAAPLPPPPTATTTAQSASVRRIVQLIRTTREAANLIGQTDPRLSRSRSTAAPNALSSSPVAPQPVLSDTSDNANDDSSPNSSENNLEDTLNALHMDLPPSSAEMLHSPDEVLDLQISRDGLCLFTLHAKCIRLWSAYTGNLLRDLLPSQSSSYIQLQSTQEEDEYPIFHTQTLCISGKPSAEFVAAVTNEDRILIWRTTQTYPIHELDVQKDRMKCFDEAQKPPITIALHPADSSLMAMIGCDRSLHFWSPRKSSSIKRKKVVL